MTRWQDFLNSFNLVPKRSTRSRFQGIATLLVAILAYGATLAASGVSLRSAVVAFSQIVAGSSDRVFDNLIIFCPLVLLSFGVAVGKKPNLWNVGADGQMLAGAIVGFIAGTFAVKWSPSVFAPCAAAAAAAGSGACLAGSVAWLKIKYKSDEVFLFLMMNFLIVHVAAYLLSGPLQDPSTHWLQSPELPESLWLQVVGGVGRVTSAIALVAVCCGLLVLAERYTRWNDALMLAGDAPEALDLQGLGSGPVFLGAGLASGALCALAGWLEVAGSQHRIVENLTPGYGYYAVVVALAAEAKLGRTMFIALVFSVLINGLRGAARTVHVDVYASDVFLGFAILTHAVLASLKENRMVYRSPRL